MRDPSMFAGAETVATALERTHEQLSHSYTLTLEVPNSKQDGARHDLSFDIAKRRKKAESQKWTLVYMPYYTSSRSVRRRLADYLASPFKDLRVLSAYEIRNYWSDDDLYGALVEHWRIEEDGQVRAVLFESWVAIMLKRLQGVEGERAEEAAAKLRRVAGDAGTTPDPELARSAAAVAERFLSDRGAR